MTFKEKYNSIDQTKLPENAKSYMAEFKKDSDNFTNKQAMALMMPVLDRFIKGLKDSGYGDAIKGGAKKETKKAETPKEMAKEIVEEAVEQPETKTGKPKVGKISKGDFMKIAKEIRKEGEPWNDAMKRAGDIIRTQKEVVKKEATRQYEKLKKFIEKHPEVYPMDIPVRGGGFRKTTINRDAPRVALAKGKRVSKAGWKNQYGKSDGGKTYYEYRSNRYDTRRQRYPFLEKGGEVGSFPFLKFEDAQEAMKKVNKGELPKCFSYVEKENTLYYLPNITGDWVKLKSFETKEKAIEWVKYNLKSEGFAKGGEVDAIFADGGKTGKMYFKEGDIVYVFQSALDKNGKLRKGIDQKFVVGDKQKWAKVEVKEIISDELGWERYRGKKIDGDYDLYDRKAKNGEMIAFFQNSSSKYNNKPIAMGYTEEERFYAKGGEVEGHKHVLHIDGQNWFLEKIDSTHFYMSNDRNHRGMAHHIGQHKGEPYYEEVREWLKTTYAKGGEIEKGDNVHIIAQNKSGVVTNVISNGKHFSVKFIDGTKNVYDKHEIEKILDEGDYDEFAKGGSIYDGMSEKEFLNKYWGANVFFENPSEHFDIKKMSSSNDDKIDKFIEELKRDGYSIKKKSYSDFTSVMGVRKKMAKGGELDINKYAGAGMFARGGYMSKGELVWNKLSSAKRHDFLHKHFHPEMTPRSIEILVNKSYNFLPKKIKIKMESVYANVEEYAEGGEIEYGSMVLKHDFPKYKRKPATTVYLKPDTSKIVKIGGLGEKGYKLLYKDGSNSNLVIKQTDLDKLKNGEIIKSSGAVVSLSDKYAEGGYIAMGENYEYTNYFGIEQDDFENIVEIWHKWENISEYNPNFNSVKEEYLSMLKSMESKYGADKFNKVLDYIEETHLSHREEEVKSDLIDEINDMNQESFMNLCNNMGFEPNDWELFVNAMDYNNAEELLNAIRNGDYEVSEYDADEYAKGGVIGNFRVVPYKRIEVKNNPDLIEPYYSLAFTINGTLSEAEQEAQEYVKRNSPEIVSATITKIHPSGQPLKHKKVAYITKDEISKYAKGGEISDVKIGDILIASTGVKVKVVDYDSMFGGRVKAVRLDEYATGKPSQWMPVTNFKKFAKGGSISKSTTYIPNRNIESIHAKIKDKKVTLKGKDILDGVYAKNEALNKPFDLTDAYNEIANLSYDAWDTLKIESGSEIYSSDAVQKKLADEYEKIGVDAAYMQYNAVQRRKIREMLTDENQHSLRNYFALRGYGGDKEYNDYKNLYEQYIKEKRKIFLNPANIEHQPKKKFAKGGKIGFKGLSEKVAKYYANKSVPSKYQSLYGKKYDKAEAKEVGDKVAAKVYRQQQSKKK